jgi:hypothetical protein
MMMMMIVSASNHHHHQQQQQQQDACHLSTSRHKPSLARDNQKNKSMVYIQMESERLKSQ